MKMLLVVALCAPLIAHADDKSDAQALFDRGISEMKEGKLDEACKHLAASLAKLPDSGTRGALAVCSTKQGKIATAWTLWKELAVTAPTDAMKSNAAKAASELEPRLPRYQLTRKPAIAGLIVTINGTQVDLSVDVPLPVDPGKVSITASAPELKAWSGEATASEAQVTPIEIPDLVADPKPVVTPPPPVVIEPARPKVNWTARGLMIGGGVSLVVGGIFGLRASKLWNDAENACGDIDACPGDVFVDASDKYDGARTSAIVSTIFVGAGAAALIGGVALWYVQRDKPTERTALIPTVSPDGFGIAVTGSLR
jgi:hypothetical protein